MVSESKLSPEDLVRQMSRAELLELLRDLGLESTDEMALSFVRAIARLGSIDAVFESLGGGDLRRRAA